MGRPRKGAGKPLDDNNRNAVVGRGHHFGSGEFANGLPGPSHDDCGGPASVLANLWNTTLAMLLFKGDAASVLV